VEIAQLRHHDEPPDRAGHVDAQLAVRPLAVVRERAFGFLDVREDAHAALVIRRAVRREIESACGALEQPHVQMRFQILDDRRDRGARQIERVRGARKAVGVDDAGEDLHCL